MLGADDFVGQWQLQRTIVDHLYGQNGVLTGQAGFTPKDANSLEYIENGTLILESGASLAATRQYLWEFTQSEVVMRFGDGAPFHQFVPTGHAAGTDHPCGEDYYKVRYDFTAWPYWTAVWRVTGPRKDYTSKSQYSR